MLGRTESRAEKDRQKQIQDKCQALLTQMLRDEDNKYCVDCDAKGPRWASWNLGIFLCIRCAGIHRNLGVHISKVKSVNLDTWTPEQVVSLQQMGNSRARAVYEATLPDTWRRPQTDSSLENFIRAKYQHKRYIAKEWVPPPAPKVDWDKELDEEAERQRKRKKEKQSAQSQAVPPVRKPIPDTKVPALPKPSSSPKASRNSGGESTAAAAKAASAGGGGIDLLGLNSPSSTGPGSEDVFTNFLSGPPPEAVAPAAGAVGDGKAVEKGRSAEEDSFFNQPTVPEDKKQLTKDSIMALYSQQSGPPMYPQGMYSNPQANPNPIGYSNGFNQLPTAFNIGQQQQNMASNPFFNMSGTNQTNQFAVQHNKASTPAQSSQFDLIGLDPTQLPQQMSGLSLNPAMSGLPQTMPGMQSLQGVAPTGPLQGFANLANLTNPAPMVAPQPFAAPGQLNPLNQLNGAGQTFTMHLWQ